MHAMNTRIEHDIPMKDIENAGAHNLSRLGMDGLSKSACIHCQKNSDDQTIH